jgi:hypothetical protein
VRPDRHPGVGLRRAARREVAGVERALEDAVARSGELEAGRAALGREVGRRQERDRRRDAADLPLVLGGNRVDVAGGVDGADEEHVVAEREVVVRDAGGARREEEVLGCLVERALEGCARDA